MDNIILACFLGATVCTRAEQLLRWETVWPQEKRHGPKSGGAVVPLAVGVGAGSPSYTMWRGPRATFVPSRILIYPAVWPRQTWAENWGRAFFWRGMGQLGPHLTQCRLGRGLPPYQLAS